MIRRIGVSMFAVVILAACSSAASGPAEAVTQYLQAKTEGNRDRLRPLLCASMEADLDGEAISFKGVNAKLENAVCKENAGTNTVTCSGQIVATYTNEQMRFPLGTYRVVQENGQWKWCGEAR